MMLLILGHKYDISELDAAFSLAQLKKTNKFIKRRKEIAKIYKEEISWYKTCNNTCS